MGNPPCKPRFNKNGNPETAVPKTSIIRIVGPPNIWVSATGNAARVPNTKHSSLYFKCQQYVTRHRGKSLVARVDINDAVHDYSSIRSVYRAAMACHAVRRLIISYCIVVPYDRSVIYRISPHMAVQGSTEYYPGNYSCGCSLGWGTSRPVG